VNGHHAYNPLWQRRGSMARKDTWKNALERVWKLAEDTFTEERQINDDGPRKIIGNSLAPCPQCYHLFLKIRFIYLKSCILVRIYCENKRCKFSERKFINSNRLKPCCLKNVNGRLVRGPGECRDCEDFSC